MAKKFVPSTEPLSAEEIQEQTRFRMEKLKALQAEGTRILMKSSPTT